MMDGLRGKGCVGGGNRGLVFKSVIKNRWLRNTAARAPCPGLPNPQSFATVSVTVAPTLSPPE